MAETGPEQALAALLKYSFQNELDPGSYNEIRDGSPNIQGKTRLFVAMGRKDRLTPKKLVSLIKTKAKVEDRKIDDVQVFDKFSFITVSFRDAERILKIFRKENRGRRPMVVMANEGRSGRR